jgi:phosphatidyl-myo-inositol dimannoside synthase
VEQGRLAWNVQMKKVMLASVDFPPHTDGVSTLSGELAHYFSEFGIDTVCIGPRSVKDRGYDVKEKYKIYRFPGYELGYLRFFTFAFVFMYVFLKHRPSKIFAMNIGYAGLLCYLLSFLFRFNYYLWGYGYEFEKVRKGFLKGLYVRIYDRAEKLFPISYFVQDHLVRYGVKNRMEIIHPGTDPDRFYPLDIPEDFLKEQGLEFLKGKKIILSVGRLVKRKGFDKVIEALPIVLKELPETYYLLAGEGPMHRGLESLARKWGVTEKVVFLGRPSELIYFYNLCDLFIMPSRELKDKGDVEGFGIVYLEANACKKPVIGGDSGGVRDAVIDGYNGLIVNPESVEEIAGATVKILKDKVLAQRFGENGYNRVINELNWRNFALKAMEGIGITPHFGTLSLSPGPSPLKGEDEEKKEPGSTGEEK